MDLPHTDLFIVACQTARLPKLIFGQFFVPCQERRIS